MLFLTLYTSYLTSLENIFPERRFFFSLFHDNFILNIYHNWPEIIVKMKCTCFFGSWNDSTVSYSCLSSVETMNASIIPNKRFKLLMKHHYQSLRAFHSQLSVARYLCCLDNSNLSITIYMWKNYSALYCSPFHSNMARLLTAAVTALVISWVHGRTAYIPASKYFWQKIL